MRRRSIGLAAAALAYLVMLPAVRLVGAAQAGVTVNVAGAEGTPGKGGFVTVTL